MYSLVDKSRKPAYNKNILLRRDNTRKTLITAFVVFLLIFSLAGCQCKHEWTDATCTSPQKCINCNITNGQPISHNLSAATCQTPKTCTVCRTTEGGLLPHSWTEATYSQPKTCMVCNVTEGDKLSHTPTEEWVIQKTDYVYAEIVKVQTCSICGEVVEREIFDLERLHDGTFFLISPEDFITRLGNTLESYTGNNYITRGASTEDSYACCVVENGDAVCILMFTKNDDTVTKDEKDDNCAFNKLLGICDADALARVACALMQTVDPTISLDDAKEYASTMLSNDSVSVNGVKYMCIKTSDGYIIGFTIE